MALAAPALASPGALDPSFGQGGRQTTVFPGPSHSEGLAMAVAPDGKTVVAGATDHNGSGQWMGSVARYGVDGQLDPSFSDDGMLVDDVPGTVTSNRAVVVQPDGKVITLGDSWKSSSQTGDFRLRRYTRAGAIDPTFGDGGTVTTDFGGNGGEEPSALALQPDGKIVAVGGTQQIYNGVGDEDFAVARYLPDGSLDRSFSGDGKATPDFGDDSVDHATGVAIAPDGGIVLVGRTGGNPSYQLAVVRLTAAGLLDSSFGGDGAVQTDPGTFGQDGASGVGVEPDGRIVVAGGAEPGGGATRLAVWRYLPSGALDPTFSDDGEQLLAAPSPWLNAGASALALQADGKMVLGGVVSGDHQSQMAVARMLHDGTPDASFAPNGIMVNAFPGGISNGLGVGLAPDGKIVQAGWFQTTDDSAFAVTRYLPGDGIIDQDADGVSDADDACPNNPGPASNDGCPLAAACSDGIDNDGDGLVDQADRGCSDALDDDETNIGEAVQPAGPIDECSLYPTGINGCALQPGDILLWRSAKPSFSEENLGGTFWTHAAIVIGYMNIETNDAGRELVIADSQPDVNGVDLRSIIDTPFGQHDGENPRVTAFRLEGVPSAIRTAAATGLLAHILGPGGATRHTFWHAPNFIYSHLPFAIPSPSGRGPTEFYCSGLVWWAYHQLHIDISGHDRLFNFVDHAFVTPDDLISDAKLRPRNVAHDRPVKGGSISVTSTTTTAAHSATAAAATGPPAHLLVVDKAGRKTGKSATGHVYQQIPGAIWRHSDHDESVSATAIPGDWKVMLSGTRRADYALVVETADENPAPRAVVTDTTAPGKTTSMRVAALSRDKTCLVPRVTRLPVRRAKRALRRAHCRLATVKGHGRHIRRQRPLAGTPRPADAPVVVVLGR